MTCGGITADRHTRIGFGRPVYNLTFTHSHAPLRRSCARIERRYIYGRRAIDAAEQAESYGTGANVIVWLSLWPAQRPVMTVLLAVDVVT